MTTRLRKGLLGLAVGSGAAGKAEALWVASACSVFPQAVQKRFWGLLSNPHRGQIVFTHLPQPFAFKVKQQLRFPRVNQLRQW